MWALVSEKENNYFKDKLYLDCVDLLGLIKLQVMYARVWLLFPVSHQLLLLFSRSMSVHHCLLCVVIDIHIYFAFSTSLFSKSVSYVDSAKMECLKAGFGFGVSVPIIQHLGGAGRIRKECNGTRIWSWARPASRKKNKRGGQIISGLKLQFNWSFSFSLLLTMSDRIKVCATTAGTLVILVCFK